MSDSTSFNVKKFWESVASSPGNITPGNQWRKELVDSIISSLIDWIPGEVRKKSSLLDIGCGEGRLIEGLAGTVGTYCGADISPTVLSRAKDVASGLALKNCKFVEVLREDIGGLGKFDIIVSFSVFMHLPVMTFIKYLRSCYDNLNLGGYFAFQIPGSDHFSQTMPQHRENRFDVISDEKRYETRWYPDYLIASYLTLAGFYIVGTPSESSLTWKCRKF